MPFFKVVTSYLFCLNGCSTQKNFLKLFKKKSLIIFQIFFLNVEIVIRYKFQSKFITPTYNFLKGNLDSLRRRSRFSKESSRRSQVALKESPPFFQKNPLQTTACVTSDAKHSTTQVLCLLRQVEWIITIEQCGVLGILCHTSSSLQEGLLALRMNRVSIY